MDNIIAADSSPYPEIRVRGENKRLGALISPAFGGNAGEFYTVAEYTRQSIIFKEGFPEYSQALMQIALVEMRHMRMLGELMTKLGVLPDYEGFKWSSEERDERGDDLALALLFDLSGEQRAYAEYISLARRSGDRYVFDLLTRIALDEMVHINLLRSMINKLRHAQ